MQRSTFFPVPPSSSFLLHPRKFKPKLPPHQSAALSPISTLQCPQPVRQNPSPTSAYIHLPFCRHRCHYCDFTIIALGNLSPSPENDPRISNYVHLLLREIQSTRSRPNPHPPLQTLFFGGGTPSLIPPKLLSSVLDVISSKFGISPDAEISIEMDPGTFDKKKLDEIVGLGVNRVSLGVQAFQEEMLRGCGRAHGVKEVEEAVEMVNGCDGLENWSLDLISSLPYQREEMWRESLRRAVEAGPTHVSVYDLQVEKGTKFAHLYTPGEFPLPTETQSADFYRIASETLTNAGYDHYEISSYCKGGYECSHNLTYWQNKPFYGFGLGSTSYVDGVRFSRPKRLKDYTNYVLKLENEEVEKSKNLVVEAKDMAMDVVMLSLRTARGLDMCEFERSYGKELASALYEAFRPYIESGHVIVMNEDRRRLGIEEFEMRKEEVGFLRLSDPDGFLLSNELISIAFGVISP